MAGTATKVEQTGKGRRSSIGAVVLGALLLALVVLAAWKQEELSNYWRLQGWNTGAVKETV